jgi:hypothetical protein
VEFVPIIRLIWRRRVLLATGVFCAAWTLVALGGTSSVTNKSALAWTHVALDTPKSQLVEAAPNGAATLIWRAGLLMHLMATDASTQNIARRVGVAADQVLVVDSNLGLPAVSTAMAQAASTAASLAVAPYTLTVAIDNNAVPVITIMASAVNPASAQRLAAAAVALLESQTSPGGSVVSGVFTGGGTGLELQPFKVEQIAPIRVKLLSSSSPQLKAIGASLVVFAFWVAGGLMMPRAIRRIRPRPHADNVVIDGK